jgi:hypothetical protein
MNTTSCGILETAVSILVIFVVLYVFNVIVLCFRLDEPVKSFLNVPMFCYGSVATIVAVIGLVSQQGFRDFAENVLVGLRRYTLTQHRDSRSDRLFMIVASGVILGVQILAFGFVLSIPRDEPDTSIVAYQTFIRKNFATVLSNVVCDAAEVTPAAVEKTTTTLSISTSGPEYLCILSAEPNRSDPNKAPVAWQRVIQPGTYQAFDGSGTPADGRAISESTLLAGSGRVLQSADGAQLVLNLVDRQIYIRYGDVTQFRDLSIATAYGERVPVTLNASPGHIIISGGTVEILDESYEVPPTLCSEAY